MTRSARLVLLAATLLPAWLAAVAARGSDDENWQRLRSFPREQRQHLAEKLREFDALDRGTQDVIRKLDAKLAELPDGDRANYLAALRRYHLWLDDLSDAQRTEISNLPPDRRMAAVSKMVAGQSSQRRTSPLVLRYSDFGDFSPYELADQVKIWQVLTPAQRSEVSRLPEAQRNARLERLMTQLNVSPVPRPVPADEEATIKRVFKRSGVSAFLTNKKIGERIGEAKARSRIADHLRFVEYPPPRVTTENLSRFAASLPSWIRALDDPLPPDEARRRLTVLYRLLYPSPAEYVASKAPAPPAAKAAVPVPGKAGGNTTPF
jgi:hypothetical protein